MEGSWIWAGVLAIRRHWPFLSIDTSTVKGCEEEKEAKGQAGEGE